MSPSRRQFLLRAATGLGVGAAAACSTAGQGGPAATPRTAAARTTSPPPGPAVAPTPTSTPPASAVDHSDLVHGPRTTDAVALTFHGAGDPSLTRRVLRLARSADAQLTVLAVGSWLDVNRQLAGAILDGGHELGNHTWSHLPMRRLSPSEARTEVARAADLLDRLTGTSGRWFRPSGTPSSTPTIRAAAVAAGYERCLAYDVDPRDYQDPGAAAIVARVDRAVRPGSIVSLHLGHPGTVEALPGVFAALRRHGLRAVTVSGLLA